MTVAELHDHIYCWLWLYEHMPFPPSTGTKVVRLNESAYRKWEREMLLDVTTLSIPEELEGSSTEEDLRSAIQVAQSGDVAMIQHIADLLMTVNADIIKHPLRRYSPTAN